MPTAVREQILAAAAAQLAGVTGAQVERNRTAPVVTFPTLVLRDGGMTPDDQTLGLTRYRLRFQVEGWVDAAGDALLGPALSDLQARAVAALVADVTLGGLAVDLAEGETADPEIDRGEGRRPVAAFSTDFRVEFFTREGDPFQPGP